MLIIENTSHLVELEFYNEVFRRIEAANLGDFDFVVSSTPPDKAFEPLPDTGRPKVVFSFSDEKNRLPDYSKDNTVVVVFKCYAPFTPDPKLCPIPLPYKAGFKANSRPFNERRTKLFYSGHANGGNRKELQKVFNVLKFPDSIVNFTSGFGAGFNSEQFAAILGDSKYAICPAGNNSETFRHIEAAMSGCVIISDHQPAFWYNHQVPFIYVNDWTELPTIFEYLEANPAAALQLHHDTLAYYDKYLSVEAVSKVCINTIKHELSKK